ncbi:MAG: tetratricopeptide repeat protein [Spirochaetia bacterium]|nr:tetratricopeptide repeat protein [Spirochaetia bacterium]
MKRIIILAIFTGIVIVNCKGKGNDKVEKNDSKKNQTETSQPEKQAANQNTRTSGAADELNSKAMAFYKKKDYENAVNTFQEAIKAAPEHKLANYNLACVYALSINECRMIEFQNSAYGDSDLYAQLEKAIKLDDSVKEKAKKDGDFKKIKNEIRFQKLTEQLPDSSSTAEWKNLLVQGKAWYTGECSGGVYGCSTIKFLPDNTIRYEKISNPCIPDPESEECSDYKNKMKNIKYEIANSEIILNYQDGTKEIYALPGHEGSAERPALNDIHPDPCSM